MNFLTSIQQISETEWDGLWQTDYPFIQHRFLSILEITGCTTRESGWEPYHLIVKQGERLVFALILYRKHHSYGEYVFDWGWADAYHRSGMEYYPKLLAAIPFTPATGPRMAFAGDLDDRQRSELFMQATSFLRQHCQAQGYSSIHLLFPERGNRRLCQSAGWRERRGHQFHWFNRQYQSFDDFLSRFNSRKRKSVNRERRKVEEAGVEVQMVAAGSLAPEDWRQFFSLYHRTYLKRSGRPGYLTDAFFQQLAKAFPEQVLLCRAQKNGETLAAALYLRDAQTLYGRYWGAVAEFDGLHFEACYYQGIDYAIAQGLKRFDPGAQGEHKIQRGFVPVQTCSFHWMQHQGFDQAVAEFVQKEHEQNLAYIKDGRTYLPFREGEEITASDCLL